MSMVCNIVYAVINFLTNSFLAIPIEERFRIVLINFIASEILLYLPQLLLSPLTRFHIREEANAVFLLLKNGVENSKIRIKNGAIFSQTRKCRRYALFTLHETSEF